METIQKQSRTLSLNFNTDEALAAAQTLATILHGNVMSDDFNKAAKSALVKIRLAFENKSHDDGPLSPR